MAFFAIPGSDESVSLSDRTLILKMKQAQLEQSVLDRVKLGLDSKFTEEDSRYIEIASFPTDSPELEAEEMPTIITAKIMDCQILKKHFEVKEFIDVLYSQPWMAKAAIEDVHQEEVIRTKELALDHLENTVFALERSIGETTSEVTMARKKIEEIEFANTLFETETAEEHEPQVWAKMVKENEILAQEKLRLEANVRVLSSDLEKFQLQLPPKKDRVEVASMQLAKMKDGLEQRNNDRKRKEEAYAKELASSLITDLQNNAARLAILREKGRALETAVVRGVPQQLINLTADLETQDLLNESNYHPIYALQDALHRVTPHVHDKGLRSIELMLHIKSLSLNSVIHHYQFREDCLTKEIQLFSDFSSTKSFHEDRMEMFLTTQLQMRRQHALQKELDQRLQRLNDLRNIRMAAIKKLREKAQEEERIKAELEAKKVKAAEKPLTTVLVEGVKNGIRKAADDYRKMKERHENGMTAEEERMAGYLRKKNASGGSVEAIRKIRITGTREETEQFQRQNDILFQKGLPFYRMMERGIGSQGDIFLWFEMTKVPEEMITHLELSHREVGNERHKRLESFGYEKISSSNPEVKLELYVKRDKRKDKAINAMRVSYEQSEETRFTVDQYQKVDDGVSLSEFGLPDVYLWFHQIEKGEKAESANTNALIAELKATRKMLKSRPNDMKLKELVQKLEKQVDAAMHNEITAQVTDPLAYAVEILALGEKDLKKFMKVFQKIDRKKVAKITTDDLFEFLGLPPTEFNLYMIHSLESLGADSMLEFGDFMRTFAIFGLFGQDDILRLCFTFADTENQGKITHAQFLRLLNQLHPYDKSRTKRALAELDLSPTKEMDYAELQRIHGTLPSLLYPAFQLQFIMREKTMGDDWWVKKLLAYRSVRQKLAGSRLNADDAAATEMGRIARDEARKKRMDDRAQRILQTSSALEKAILNARQLADEFS